MIGRLNHVAIAVPDLAGAAAQYRDVLGARVSDPVDQPDHGVTVVAFLGLSMPDFWLAILLIIVFAANLHWLPAIGYVPLAEGFWPWFSHLIMPAIAIGTPFAAIIARMIRRSSRASACSAASCLFMTKNFVRQSTKPVKGDQHTWRWRRGR